MEREYFHATVQRVSIEAKEVREEKIARSGFLNLRKTIFEQIHFEDEYFIFCKLDSTNVVLKIKTTKEILEQARTGDSVSVHLRFDFEFACYHFIKIKEEEKVIQVERKIVCE